MNLLEQLYITFRCLRKWGAALGLCSGVLVYPVFAGVLTLYNTIALENTDTTPLPDGSLVQLIYVGANGVVDVPDIYGLPGGDDVLVTDVNNPTATGVGVPGTDTGLLEQFGMTFDNSLVGMNSYVRFWNGLTLPIATHYGESPVYPLPAPDLFDQAELDFMPSATGDQQVDTAFSAQNLNPGIVDVPEPDCLAFIGFGLAMVFIQRKLLEASASLVLAGLLFLFTGGSSDVYAQLPARLDVMVSLPMVDASGDILAGSHPSAGALVQVLDAGPNGVVELPDAEGLPTGDDVILLSSKVGQGIAPSQLHSGRFCLVVDAAPADGAKVYVRLFNKPTLEASTHFGQSLPFTVNMPAVFHADDWGLWGTNIPKHGNLAGTDTDLDGASDLEELLANTNAEQAGDVFAVTPAPGNAHAFDLRVKPGRIYQLYRSTDALNASMTWSKVGSPLGPFSVPAWIRMEDPAPPSGPRAYYRAEVFTP